MESKSGQVKKRRSRGDGSIYQRNDGMWVASTTIGHDSTGKIKRKTLYGSTKKAVKDKLDAFKREQILNDGVVVQNDTFEAFINDWVENTKRNQLSVRSYDRLRQTCDLYIIPMIGFRQVQSIQSSDIQALINKLRDDGYSRSTIKKVYDAINACYKNAIVQRKVVFNPVAGVTVPKPTVESSTELRFFTEDEVKRIVAVSSGRYSNGTPLYRLGYAYIFILNTGLRAGEMCSLHWDDIDTSNRTVFVHRNRIVYKGSGEKYSAMDKNSPKTASGYRKVPLNDAAMDAVENLRAITGGGTYFLCATDGSQCTQSNLDHTFRRILAKAGIKDSKNYGVHSLRHTFATMMLSNGVDIKIVSSLLGHSDITVTYNTYIHVVREMQVAAVNSLPEL